MYSVEKLLDQYGDLYNEQLFLESRFKKEAEDKLKFNLEKERIDGNAGTHPLGQHLTRFVFDKVRNGVEKYAAVKSRNVLTVNSSRELTPSASCGLALLSAYLECTQFGLAVKTYRADHGLYGLSVIAAVVLAVNYDKILRAVDRNIVRA